MGVVKPAAGEWPEVLGVHLHTHDVAVKKYLVVRNSDGTEAFRSAPERAGYGLEEQSFANLADKAWPRLKLKAGQELAQHCVFEATRLEAPVRYGLDWGEEMCAPLLVLGGPGLRVRPTVLSSDDGFLLQLNRRLQAWATDILRDLGRIWREL